MSDKLDSFGTSYSFKKINEKDPIVFIHGVGLAKEIWNPQINFFKEDSPFLFSGFSVMPGAQAGFQITRSVRWIRPIFHNRLNYGTSQRSSTS